MRLNTTKLWNWVVRKGNGREMFVMENPVVGEFNTIRMETWFMKDSGFVMPIRVTALATTLRTTKLHMLGIGTWESGGEGVFSTIVLGRWYTKAIG